MDKITQLCKKYTDLTDEEIAIIAGMTGALEPLANLEEADIFIDCPSWDGDAIVVAEAKPTVVPSSYKKTVVGLLAKPENEPAVARTLRLGVATRQMKAITQERTHVVQTVEPIRSGHRVIGVLIREKRADEQQTNSERLHFSQQSYKRIANALTHMADENNWLTECIDEALLMVNSEGIVTFCNSLAQELYHALGYVEDVLGQPYENIRLVQPDAEDIEEESKYTAVEIVAGSRTLTLKRIRLDAPDMAFAVVIQDITRIKEQEKQLILKSVAIKEMHHRIKNNLQTIASLLRLQVRRSDNTETRQVLGETMNRILSIATTHELLAQSGVDEVMIGEVLTNIKNNAIRSFSRPHFDITLSLEGDDFKVESDVATSVALVTNELLQNSLQYAFHNRSHGMIRIVVTEGELYSRIQIMDNGCGFDAKSPHNDRLGLSIVHQIVKDKLRGKLMIESDSSGTSVTFDFKNRTMQLGGVM